MSHELYQQIKQVLTEHSDPRVSPSSLERLTLLVLGIIKAENAAPARIAKALDQLGLTTATEESIERRVRRIENDPSLQATSCVHPLARSRLQLGRPQRLILIIDPTSQDERVVMLTVSVWYRGRALPLAWAIWPGQQPLTDAGFWERVAALLQIVAELLPLGVPVIWLADRAFGSPAFTDLLVPYGWDYVVRVQDQTRFRDQRGREFKIGALVSQPNRRTKRHGQVFKKRGWRWASVVAFWGQRHSSPLCLVTSLPPRWEVIALYRRRYPIEAMFRHYKSYGWQWERGQVTDLAHLERLLVGMALATWLVLLVGTQVAAELLAQPATGLRRTRPWVAKQSLFSLGLHRLGCWLHGATDRGLAWSLADWDAPNWSTQISAHHARAFVFAFPPPS